MTQEPEQEVEVKVINNNVSDNNSTAGSSNSSTQKDTTSDQNTNDTKHQIFNFMNKLGNKVRQVGSSVQKNTQEFLNKPEVKEMEEKLKKQAEELKYKYHSGELEKDLKTTLNKASEVTSQAVSNLQSTTTQAVSNLQVKTLEWRKQQAIGKFLTVTVHNVDNQVIAKRGDVITRDIINLAESQNQLETVLNSYQEEHPGII